MINEKQIAQINEPTIEQMNVVIAAFEGRKFYGHTIDKFGGDTGNTLPEMKYHISWDWLMPCWDRLRTVVSDYFDEDYPAEYCSMCDIWGLHCEHVNINVAHRLLHDAIQWLNQQKQNDGNENI